MVQEQILLDDLSINGVNIRKQKYYYEDGQEPEPIGKMWRVALQNSERGREEIKEVLGEDSHEYKAVMQMWGDEPTIVEPIQEPMTMPEEYESSEEDVGESSETLEGMAEVLDNLFSKKRWRD